MPRFGMVIGSVATALASAGAVYSPWIALSYDGGTAGLASLATVTCVGVACAAPGLHHRSRFITGPGLPLAALAPVDFAWISSVASLLVGTALLFREILKRRKRKRRGSKLESDEPSMALEDDEADVKSKPSSFMSPTPNG